MCDVSRCIPDVEVCDGKQDCSDGTDENCPGKFYFVINFVSIL